MSIEGLQLTERQQAAIDAVPAHIAILDEDGVVIGVNRGWRDYGDEHGLLNDDIGRRYLDVVAKTCFDQRAVSAERDGVARVVARELAGYSSLSICDGEWFRILAVPIGDISGPALTMVLDRHLEAAPDDDEFMAMGDETSLRFVGARTVCGWCRERGLDTNGRWVSLDGPVEGRVSHGLCDVCAETLFPT